MLPGSNKQVVFSLPKMKEIRSGVNTLDVLEFFKDFLGGAS